MGFHQVCVSVCCAGRAESLLGSTARAYCARYAEHLGYELLQSVITKKAKETAYQHMFYFTGKMANASRSIPESANT